MSSAIRAFVHHCLSTNPALTALVSTRVYQQGAVLTAQAVKPYLVHHFGNNTDEGMYDEDNFKPNRQFMQVFVHTSQGDYGPVDDLVALVKVALQTTVGRPPGIIQIRYLETSQDLQDDLLQTYFRYMRFQIILSE